MNDLIKIKKLYGEEMMHLCRKLFPTLLEQENLLLNTLLSTFAPSRLLAEDIINMGYESLFQNYIYFMTMPKEERKVTTNKTPQELMDEAGYTLFECRTEEEIKEFKKYYQIDELLCTFKDTRTKGYYVFFAIKKNVDQIFRSDNPKRDDEYGTSVISIQFTKGKVNTLSIKNRYNHTVENPDATLANNLENIVPGLTESFERMYGLNIRQNSVANFEFPGYVMANDGKFYKYNYEINNIYYCPNNIIIDKFQVKKYEPERYIVLDYFIIDLSTKTISLYDKQIEDDFPETIKNIKNIKVTRSRDNGNKRIEITTEHDNKIIIVIDKTGKIIEYFNEEVIEIKGEILCYNEKSLRLLELPNVRRLGNNFMAYNESLVSFLASQLEQLGDNCFSDSRNLVNFYAPNLKIAGDDFLACGDVSIYSSDKLEVLDLPSLVKVGDNFLINSRSLRKVRFDNLVEVGDNCLENAKNVISFIASKLTRIGNSMLRNNAILETFYAPNVIEVGSGFLCNSTELKELKLGQLKRCGNLFLFTYKLINNINQEASETAIAKINNR